MNKKTILGLLTGAAIVAATTGSYAAWDKLDVTHSSTISIAKPVTVTTALTDSYANLTSNEDTRTLGTDVPVYSVDMPINVEAGSHDVDLKVEASVSGIDGASASAELYDAAGNTKIESLEKIPDGSYTVRTTITMPTNAPDNVGSVNVTTTASLSASTTE